ncbi:MAG: aminopeptidase P family protein, partial [Deltaproteobacteria bacterium]|nr:aminopeptidase P family protein [Deltaproteobacteria bacterium]
MKDLGIVEKVRRAIEDCEYDAVIAVGADNVQYLSGAALPFLYSHHDQYVLVLWPKESAPVCICPIEWEATLRNLTWIRRIRSYIGIGEDTKAAVEAFAQSVRDTVKDGAKLGIDMNRVSYGFFNELQESLFGMELLGCDEWLNELRMTKTLREVELLEDAAYRTDHGILGAAHHILVRRRPPEAAIAEQIRVHCLERLLDLVGHHAISQVASGENSKKFWPLAPRFGLGGHKELEEGEMVRMEMRASLDGYWSDAARMLAMGEPTPEQRKAYESVVILRETAIRYLKPGTRCNEVFRSVKEEAEREGIPLISDLGVGHGVGVTTHEPPYLNDGDETELRPGMVLVLDPIVYGPDKEIMRSKDTVLITET